MRVRLVQISDLHLGRSFGNMALPDELRDQLAQASLDALAGACELVRQRDAAALLIPGDLFNRPEVDEELAARVHTLFEELQRPVLVSPGNHDAFGPMSVWNNAALHKLGLRPWPENVHVFSSRKVTPHALLAGELIVHGHRVEGYHSASDSPLADVEITKAPRFNVLLIHGALEGTRFTSRTTVPFTAKQLAEIGADYAAVGHYHRFSRIEHNGQLLGAYAGVPVPGEIDEDPHGGLLVVTLQEGEAEVERVDVYPGRILRLPVDGNPPFRNCDDARVRSLSAAGREGLGRDDIVFIRLTGFSDQPLDPGAIEEELRPHFRHVTVSDNTEPETLQQQDAADLRVTVESQFVAALRERIKECDDVEHIGVLESALRYGMRALRGRAVLPPAATETTGDAAQGHED